MALVDKQIRERVETSNLIESYHEICLTNIGYDLRSKRFYRSDSNKEGEKSVTLMPNESVFVESVETVTMPEDLLGRVTLKNSRIRQGLTLEAPVYQPGHKTRIYFRLTNVSADSITLYEAEKYAMIIFEQLAQKPDCPYDGTFQNEFDFRNMGDYTDVYKRQIRELEKKAEDIKEMESGIYGNVLTILSVFVALFSLVTINIELIASAATLKYYCVLNALLLGCISFLVALLNTFLKPKKLDGCKWIIPWIPSALAFSAAIILYLVF